MKKKDKKEDKKEKSSQGLKSIGAKMMDMGPSKKVMHKMSMMKGK